MDTFNLGFSEILDWIEGRLDPAHAARLERRLGDAPPERISDGAWLRSLVEAKSDIALESAPDSVRALTRARFREYHSYRVRFPNLKLFLASLRFDSLSMPAASGIRSPGLLAEPRHLLYNTEIADIAVDVHRCGSEGRLDVMGQLFPNAGFDPSAFRIQLARGAESMGARHADELGEFLFPDVLPGDYHMILSTGELGILVTPVNLSF